MFEFLKFEFFEFFEFQDEIFFIFGMKSFYRRNEQIIESDRDRDKALDSIAEIDVTDSLSGKS